MIIEVENRFCKAVKASSLVLWTFFTGGPILLAPTVANAKVHFGSAADFSGSERTPRRSGSPENRACRT